MIISQTTGAIDNTSVEKRMVRTVVIDTTEECQINEIHDMLSTCGAIIPGGIKKIESTRYTVTFHKAASSTIAIQMYDQTKFPNSNNLITIRESEITYAMPKKAPEVKEMTHTVIIRHMFAADKQPETLLEVYKDLFVECSSIGRVTKCTIFDQEDEGICTVRFSDSGSAAVCVRLMQGRWYDGRQLQCRLLLDTDKLKRTKI